MESQRTTQFTQHHAARHCDVRAVLSEWPIQPAWREQRRPTNLLPKNRLNQILNTYTESAQWMDETN